MKLESCKRLECGKSETPENTIAFLEEAIWNKHEYRYIEQKVDEHLYWSALFVDDLEFRSMGKGISPIMSKAGALAEAAEWLTARELGMLPGFVEGRQEEMDNPLKIEDMLTHVSSLTPESLEFIKSSDAGRYWVDGYSLRDDRPVKVPVEFLRRIAGPSGMASGNHKEEAMEHAMCEIFERRAHITVLRNRMVMPTVDPDTIENDLLQEHMEFIRSKGIEVTLKDLSFGGELPCIGAYFKDTNIPDEYQFHHFFKVGSAFNREEALIRCFTEYVQGRKKDEFIENTKSEQDRVLNQDFRNVKCIDERDDNFMSAFMFGMAPHRDLGYMYEGDVVPFDPGIRYDDMLDDVKHCMRLFDKLGKDTVIVDFTDPQIGFPVIQVIVPSYSDVLPYHPANSDILFNTWSRSKALKSYRKM
jgi:YcaO-like protein with predicted kinase domain